MGAVMAAVWPCPGFLPCLDWWPIAPGEVAERPISRPRACRREIVRRFARSTWQAWEDPARDALPDVAALAAVADACRIEPGAALEWLVTEHEHRAQETAPAATPMIGGRLKIEVNGF